MKLEKINRFRHQMTFYCPLGKQVNTFVSFVGKSWVLLLRARFSSLTCDNCHEEYYLLKFDFPHLSIDSKNVTVLHRNPSKPPSIKGQAVRMHYK